METQLCRVLSHSGNITKLIHDLDNLYAVRRKSLQQFPRDMSFADNYGNLIVRAPDTPTDCLCSFSGPLVDVKKVGKGQMSTAHLVLAGPEEDKSYYIWKDSVAPIPPMSLQLSSRGSLRAPNFYHMLNISMVLAEILQPLNLWDSILRQFDAYVCCNSTKGWFSGPTCKGWSITDWADRGTLAEWLAANPQITWKELNQIFRDVFTPLQILKQAPHQFVHGDLKPANVFVQSTRRLPNNKPVSDSTAVRFLLADFDKSSVTYHGVRFVGEPTYAKMHRLLRLDTHVVLSPDGSTYRLSDTFLYPGAVNKILGTSMFSAYPMPLSFDLYTFVVGLCLDPGVYNIAFRELERNENTQRFDRLWRNLWDPEEIDDITAQIGNQILTGSAKQNNSIKTIIGLIYKKRLRVNVAEFYWEFSRVV